jgi:hypothetical protein
MLSAPAVQQKQQIQPSKKEEIGRLSWRPRALGHRLAAGRTITAPRHGARRLGPVIPTVMAEMISEAGASLCSIRVQHCRARWLKAVD